MTNQKYNQINAPASISLRDKVSDTLILLGVSKEVTMNLGLTETIDYGLNNLGIERPVTRRVDREDFEITATLPNKTIDAMGLVMNRKWEKVVGATPVNLIGDFVPTKNTYAAATGNLEGTGVLANPAGAKASANIDGISEPLTIGTFATFNSATATKSIAFGADGAIKVSDDLIGKPIVYNAPYTLTNLLVMSEVAYVNFELILTFIMTDQTLLQARFPDVQPKMDGRSVNFGQAGVQVAWRSFDDGTRCVPVDMIYLGKTRRCAA